MKAAGKCRKNIAKLEVDSHSQSSFRKLANIANLSIADEEFINNVNCDIEHFLKQRHINGVLLFPPVNNFRRFLIHQTCESFRIKYDLFTFSVGQGPFRRTVVCFKNQLLDPQKYSDSSAAANFEIRHKYSTPAPLKSWRSDNRRVEPTNFSTTYITAATNKRELRMGVDKSVAENKINKFNSGELYRPPALRNHAKEVLKRYKADSEELVNYGISKSTETNEPTTASSPTAANVSITTTTSISCNNSPIHRNENVITNNCTTSAQQNSACKSQQQQQQVDEQQKQPQRQQQTRRERRPDRAVYIPRARRSQTTPPTTTTQIQPPTQQQQQSTQLPVPAPTSTTTIEETSRSLNQQLAITLDDTTTVSVHHKPSSKAVEVGKVYSGGVFVDSTCCNNSTTTINKKEKINKESREQRREKRLQKKLSTISTQHNQIYKNNEQLNETSINIISNNDNSDDIGNQALILNVQQMQSSLRKNDVNNVTELNDNINNFPKGFNCDSSDECILNKEPKLFVNATANCEVESLLINPFQESEFLNSVSNTSEHQFQYEPPARSIEIVCKTAAVDTTNITVNNCNTNTMPKISKKIKSNKANCEVVNETKLPNLSIEDVASQQTSAKCDVEEEELQRASKEINRSNRRIIKQTFISDVLQIPDHVSEDKPGVTEEPAVTKEPQMTSQIDSFTEDEEDEDDWENMFDDSGDCLDPKIMQELTASVGKCKIELPKMDYTSFLTKQSILNEEEFPHVLEVSNFPVEFKNQDLLMVFSQYKESGFDIKWVDDTHALAVFSSSRIAAEVLTMGHPFVVLKPLAEATIESRLKAKKCAASLQPYRPRPETCAALARRLVTGALGVRLKTAAAERENEKRVLREAKERKLLAAKQRDEVWDS